MAKWSTCTSIACVILITSICCQMSGSYAKSRITERHGSKSRFPNPVFPGKSKRHRPNSNIVLPGTVTDLHEKQGEESPLPAEDILLSTFNIGFQRLFNFLRNRIFTRPEVEAGNSPNENEETKYKFPGFPTTTIFNSYNLTSIINLLEATDPSQVENLAEHAIVDTATQLIGIIGFNDLRDWLGIIMMYFLLGPIMIPLFWLPISLFGMAGLLVPLFYHNPPSKLNDNVMGHDPIIPEFGGGEGRSISALITIPSSSNNFTVNVTGEAASNLDVKNATSTETDSPGPSILEVCMERFSCQLARIYRDNPISQWVTRRFNVTKVEWARDNASRESPVGSTTEDCKKYNCSILPTVRSLMSSWGI